MVNKFKTLLKKEKGFTLVELLAVIVILGIIVAIAIPAVGNIIDKAETDANSQEQALIIDAARLYMIQGDGASLPVTVETLETEGYLEERNGDELPNGYVSEDTEGVLTFNEGAIPE